MRAIAKDSVRTDKVQRMPEDGSHSLLGGVVVDHRNVQSCLPEQIHDRDERITASFLTYLCERLADVFCALVCSVTVDYAFGSASPVHVFPAGQSPLVIASRLSCSSSRIRVSQGPLSSFQRRSK